MKNWIFDEKVHVIRKTSHESFFAFSQDITMLKKWFISAFPEIEKISSKSGPKVRPINDGKLYLWWKGASDLQNLTRIFFRFFARYYDAEEVIHQRISWYWENISKSGPKVRPIIMKNWIFDEKVHRIRKTSHNRFSLFRKILRCWRSDSSAHFLKLRKFLKIWAQT